MTARSPRQLLTLILAAFAVAFLGAGSAAAAQPTSAALAPTSQYWIYFSQQDGEWVTSMKGPAQTTPEDGSVEGWRFAAPKDFKNPNTPRTDETVTFDAVCEHTEPKDGMKRVAVVVDFGVQGDDRVGQEIPKPMAHCAQVEEKATGLQVLQEVDSDVRIEKNSVGESVCGISGYPATGCFEEAEKATAADGDPVEFELGDHGDHEHGDDAGGSSDSDSDKGVNWALIGGVAAVIVLLAAGGVVMSRRNNAETTSSTGSDTDKTDTDSV